MAHSVQRLYRRHARIYDATRRFILPARSRAIARLGVRPGDTVFDFACGTGLNVTPLRRAGAGEIVGVDLSDAMLARARRKHPGIPFLLDDMATVDLGRTAPRVLCTWGLAFVPDVAATLHNLHRHVAPGGTLVALDFHRFEGPARPARPLLDAWLKWFGAIPPVAAAAILEDLFEEVVTETLGFGYAALTTARRPRPRPDGPPPRDAAAPFR